LHLFAQYTTPRKRYLSNVRANTYSSTKTFSTNGQRTQLQKKDTGHTKNYEKQLFLLCIINRTCLPTQQIHTLPKQQTLLKEDFRTLTKLLLFIEVSPNNKKRKLLTLFYLLLRLLQIKQFLMKFFKKALHFCTLCLFWRQKNIR